MERNWDYRDLRNAMSEYFEEHLTEDDLEHKDVDEMASLFDLYTLAEFARGVFMGEGLGMCIDRALSYMPDAIDSARYICDDDRE